MIDDVVSKNQRKKYSDEDLVDRSAFDHIKKKVEQKQAQPQQINQGIGTPVKVVFLSAIIFSGLLFSGALTGTNPFNTGDDQTTGDPPIIQGGNQANYDLTNICIQHSSLGAHYHYNVEIRIDTVPLPLPENIGISSGCMRPIHTHDAGGRIHVELPSSYTGPSPTLKDLFTIWGKSYGETSLVGYEGNVTLFVNDNNYTSSLSTYIPANGDEVLLTITTV